MFTDTAFNLALNALGEVALIVSLHEDDPGSTGARELSGGIPAYVRRTTGWEVASGARKASTAPLFFDVPAGSDVAGYGLWTTAGIFLGGGVLDVERYTRQGLYVLDVINLRLSD